MNEIQQEITPITNEDLFIILNHPNAEFNYPVHCHPEYEINLVMNTRGSRIVGDSTEDFGELDLVMTGPYLPHAWKSPLKSNHVITIQFSGDVFNSPIVNKRLFLPTQSLLLDSRQGLSFTGPEREQIRDRILDLTRMQGFQSATAFFELLNSLATANRKVLISTLYDPQVIVYASKSRRIAKVCDYIEKNLCQNLRLGDVAKLVNMSESAFSHFFKKRTNIPYITYVNKLRIARACHLLASTTLSISEICYASGFNNKSNFIRIFTKKKNMTPIEYRAYITQILKNY